MQEIKTSLAIHFKMKDMGKLHYCLGITVEQDEEQKCLWIHQKQYILSMLTKYKMAESQTVTTPADFSVKLKKCDGISKNVDPGLYQSLIESLLYASITTRPDISYVVGMISKFNSHPSEAHMTAAKRVLQYLKGTADLAFKYQKSEKGDTLIGYSDADWAGDLDDRHSATGNLFLMAGEPISWLQATISLSTSEAEYMALSAATQEVVWLGKLLSDLNSTPQSPVRLMEDNQGAIAIAKNPVAHARTKHIDIRYHYVREAVNEGMVELFYCPQM